MAVWVSGAPAVCVIAAIAVLVSKNGVLVGFTVGVMGVLVGAVVGVMVGVMVAVSVGDGVKVGVGVAIAASNPCIRKLLLSTT